MKNSIVMFVILGMVLGLTAVIGTALAADTTNAKCPVSSRPVNPEAHIDFKGGKLFFCCPGCPDRYNNSPETYATKANHQLVLTGQAAQQKCPISGGKIKASTALTVGGVEVTFCCNKCRGKVNGAEGDAQLDLVFSDKAFGKGFAVAASEE